MVDPPCHSLFANSLPCYHGIHICDAYTACTINPPSTVNGVAVNWPATCTAGSVGNTGTCTGTCTG